MAILSDITGITNSAPGYYFGPSADNNDGVTDHLIGKADNSNYTNERLSFSQTDDAGNLISGPTSLGNRTVPNTDPNTGAGFDNSYDTFQIADGVNAVFYTQPSTSNYDSNDLTSLKFAEFDDAGNFIQGPVSLQLGAGKGVKDLYSVSEGAFADFDNSFVVTYSTYNPETGRSKISYEQFDDAGNAINGGVLKTFNDDSHHGLDFGTFYSAGSTNDADGPDYILQNRVPNGNSGVQVQLKSPDMQNTIASTTIKDFGPNGEASTEIDRYNHLSPGGDARENFGVLSQTYKYVDSAGNSHEEIALEKINPTTLQVEARTKFEDFGGNETNVALQHMSNGNTLALYNDGGQSYVKEFNSSLQLVGSPFKVPKDNYGYDNFVSLGNNQFEIDWRQTATSSDSGPQIRHSAIFQA